ncbi:MAG: exo-alpha-sialidase [Spirochaetaceae bacterium]|nr:MAG: exo-alpha-sialidase [Spirochaetaceae bacterium]
MRTIEKNTRINAEHGVICAFPKDFFGYFAWPSVARDAAGTLFVGASGLRNRHVGPFGRVVFMRSTDEGNTWTTPRVIHDSPLDDRDTGVVCYPDGRRIVVSWFTLDMKRYMARRKKADTIDDKTSALIERGLGWITDEGVALSFGSWTKTSENGGITWSDSARSPVTSPHGPVLLKNGKLLYFGKQFPTDPDALPAGGGGIQAVESTDFGKSWTELGTVPLCADTVEQNYHEPHIVELENGRLVGLIRVQNFGDEKIGNPNVPHFSLVQTVSDDGGRTFSRAEPLGFHGSPAHIVRHSNGVLVSVYGYREKPYGERVALSRDGGETWEYNQILRDDGPDGDLGYPASVELDDGSIFTIYYQKPSSVDDKCGLMWSRWRLP